MGGVLAALDVAEVAQNAHPAVRVLHQEFVAPVLQRQHPAARFDAEERCPRALVHGRAVLCHSEPESLVDRLLLRLIRTAGGIHSGADRFLGPHRLLYLHLGMHGGGGSRRGCTYLINGRSRTCLISRSHSTGDGNAVQLGLIGRRNGRLRDCVRLGCGIGGGRHDGGGFSCRGRCR